MPSDAPLFRDKIINHPPHYNTGRIEVIDFIEDQNLGFHLGNVVKYVCRSRHKGEELYDLGKAMWYLQRYIKFREKQYNEAALDRERNRASTTRA